MKFDVWQRRLIDAFRRMVYRNPLVLIVLVVDCFVDLIWVGTDLGGARERQFELKLEKFILQGL